MSSNLLAHHLAVLEEGRRRAPHPLRGRPPAHLSATQPFERWTPCAVGSTARTSRGVRLHSELRPQPTGRRDLEPPQRRTCNLGRHASRAAGAPGAVAAARRLNLPMRPHRPRHLDDVLAADDLVIAVCDNAHEELPAELRPHPLVDQRSDPHRRQRPRSTRRSVNSPPVSTVSPPLFNPLARRSHDRQHHRHHQHLRHDLSIDQRLALKTAAGAICRTEFDGMFGVETIERFLHSSYDQFAGRATVPRLPAAAGRTVCAATTPRASQGRRQVERRQADRAVSVHPQRRPLADGDGILHPSRRRCRRRVVRRLRARRAR